MALLQWRLISHSLLIRPGNLSAAPNGLPGHKALWADSIDIHQMSAIDHQSNSQFAGDEFRISAGPNRRRFLTVVYATNRDRQAPGQHYIAFGISQQRRLPTATGINVVPTVTRMAESERLYSSTSHFSVQLLMKNPQRMNT